MMLSERPGCCPLRHLNVHPFHECESRFDAKKCFRPAGWLQMFLVVGIDWRRDRNTMPLSQGNEQGRLWLA